MPQRRGFAAVAFGATLFVTTLVNSAAAGLHPPRYSIRELFPLDPAHPNLVPVAINDVGQVVGNAYNGERNAIEPVMWSADGIPAPINPWPGSYRSTRVTDLNNAGVIVGVGPYGQAWMSHNGVAR